MDPILKWLKNIEKLVCLGSRCCGAPILLREVCAKKSGLEFSEECTKCGTGAFSALSKRQILYRLKDT